MKFFLRYIFLLLLPFVVFASPQIRTSSHSNKTDLTALTELISLMSNTIHSLQQERGASTGFISSDGKKFKSKLKKNKLNTDAVKHDLLASLNLNYKLLKRYYSSNDLNNLNLLFNEISTLREDVENLKIDFSKTYSKYTQVIAYLLLSISDTSDRVENKKLMNSLYIAIQKQTNA